MKHRIMIWMLALILAVFISVPALAEDDVITYTDEDGNTITVEVGEHDDNSNTDSGVIVLPEPEQTPGAQQGGTSAPQTTPAPANSAGAGNQNVIVAPAPSSTQQPQEQQASPAVETDDAQPSAEPSPEASADSADAAKGTTAKTGSGTVYAAMAALVVIIIACVVYLVRSRKKK